MYEVMPLAAVCGLGAVVGSFLNVCILRLPEGKSILGPGSHCYGCSKPINWYDNIPVLSYLMLRGKCRYCHTRFSIQYLIVEVLTGLAFALIVWRLGFGPRSLVYAVVTCALIVQAGIDLKYRIIPDFITLPGIALGLVASAVWPAALFGETSWIGGLVTSAVGVLVGGGFLYVSAMAAEWVLKKEAMGGGDIKLLGMLGAFLGYRGSIWIIFVSSLIGSVVGVYLRVRKGEESIPFGPYLGIAAFLYMVFGTEVIGWYLRYAGWS